MKKNIIVQRAEENDFAEIQKLFRKMFDVFFEDQNVEYPYTERGIIYLGDRINNGFSFVARVDGRIVGFIMGSIQRALSFKTYDKYGFIENMYVEEEHRKNGIGKMLILEFIEMCKGLNISHIQTDSDANQSLINFYTGIGFKITGINYEMKL